MNTPRSLRSHAEKFDFPEHCLFCGLSTKVYGQKRGYDVWPARTHNVDREFWLYVIVERMNGPIL